MSQIAFARVNAFSRDFSGGNPAAVCYLEHDQDDGWLQRVAKEFNLSETAFLVKRADEQADFNLRWFTPAVEVDLCGHATLAAAHYLFSRLEEQQVLTFHTRSGILKARKVSGYERADVTLGTVELNFPVAPPEVCDSVEEAKVCSALGVTGATWCGKSQLGDYLVELSDVKQVKPKFNEMLDFPGRGGAIVTAQGAAEDGFDFLSRFFCPKSGISEDPVTGSAHCTLGPYWCKKLQKQSVEGYQASERGGRVTVKLDEKQARVYLQGAAVTVMAGVLMNVV